MDSSTTPRVIQLAEQIMADIAGRGLQSGDPYLGTADAARMLGVSTTSANRAMQLLVQRNVLSRRQKRGTFVADGIHGETQRTIDRVHLVVNNTYLATEGMMADGVIVGIQSVLPHAEIEFNHLPGSDDTAWVSELIAKTARSQQAEGFVLARSSLTSQRLFQASGLPTVIFGSRFPSIQALPSVDRDHIAAGRLLTTSLIEQGVKKLGVLMRSQVLPGDHPFLDSIWRTAAELGLTPSDLTIRFLPTDDQAVQHATRDLLHQQGANGLICRSQPLAESASKTIKASKQKRIQATPIVVSDVYSRNQAKLPWATIRTVDSSESIGAKLAEILVEQAQGNAPEIAVRRLDVQLSNPPT
ncbi:Periplasmic binding proteins and sugar binding domain of LacI family protein [Bremerella volcania]|uniref:Periplasmic binding proteins and sugar binding domain of LacI family protein n=1 Tax=Bremerella volcania TaxID=2527984 RepID=A0A518C330_9BACT|nr:GntR family transcriptional regulator [Bremerella volcania]QDU73632.1 Periplasmic binding proteins and sugar binding domain of LacI family protein [Bremerella volcania]